MDEKKKKKKKVTHEDEDPEFQEALLQSMMVSQTPHMLLR